MRCVLVALMCKAHSKSGYCSFVVAKRGEGAKGQSCHLTFLHILMVPKGNSSSAVLPVLQSSVGVKKWDRMCASVCARVFMHTHVVPVLCWWFTMLSGNGPGPIFSFSLHNSEKYHRSSVSCPFFSSSSTSSSSQSSATSFPHPPPSCMCGSF